MFLEYFSKFKIIITLLCLFVIVLFFAINYHIHFSTDYGIYYIGSNFIDEDYRLYKEHDETKGHAYLFFLKLINLIFGFGVFQSFIGLYLTILLYIIFIFYICINSLSEYFKIITVLIIALSSLTLHDGNSSISFFQSAFLLMSFFFLDKYLVEKKLRNINLALCFFTIAFLTRIEVLTFLPLFFIAILISIFNGNKKIFILHTISATVIILVIFCFFSLIFLTNFNDFWFSNVTANRSDVAYELKNIKSKLFILQYRKEFFYYLFFTGIIYFVLILILYSNKIRYNFINKTFIILFLIVGILTSIYIESPELKHISVITTPSIFLIIKFINKDFKYTKILTSLGIILIVTLTILENKKIVSEINIFECIKNPYCKKSQLNTDLDIINDIKLNNKKFVILGGSPWFFLLTEKYPDEGVITGRFYHSNNTFFMKSKYLLEKHNKYVKENNLEFYMPNHIVNSPNFYSKELLKNSILLKKFNNYSKFKIIIN